MSDDMYKISTPTYRTGDHVEVLVSDQNDFSHKSWVPAEVHSVEGTRIKCVRRGSKLERFGAIALGFVGDYFVCRSNDGGIRHVEPAYTGTPKPLTPSPSLEQRAMRSAVAWYVEFMERERDGKTWARRTGHLLSSEALSHMGKTQWTQSPQRRHDRRWTHWFRCIVTTCARSNAAWTSGHRTASCTRSTQSTVRYRLSWAAE